MLGPVLLLVGILTMAGYFQLFAEPYVMTQGGPLQSTVSVLYLMYEEGFKWWNLGNASAVAFLLFLLMTAVTSGLLWFARRQGRGMNASRAVARGRHGGQRRCWSCSPCVSLAPLLWMLSVSFMQTGEASHFPPPLLPADADAAQLPRAVRARRHGPLPRSTAS